MTTFRYNPINELGSGWREKRSPGQRKGKGVIQKLDWTAVYPDGTVEEFVTLLREKAALYEDARVDTDSVTSYYDSVEWTFYVTGWREATPEELESQRVVREEAENRAREWEERQIRELRRIRPELFKD